MSTTVVDHPLTTNVTAAAEVLTSLLPSLGGWQVDPLTAPAVSDIVPANARAVVAPLDGVGRIVLLASAPLAAGVPGDGEDGMGQLVQALSSAATAAGFAAGLPTEVGADTALLTGANDTVIAVRLVDGGNHMASLALVVEAVPAVPASFAPVPEGLGVAASIGGGSYALELLHDVEMAVTVELGRTRMLLRDVLALSVGSVIELDRAAGSLVDLFVNGTLIARGEVVVVGEEFGVRIAEVVGPNDGNGRR